MDLLSFLCFGGCGKPKQMLRPTTSMQKRLTKPFKMDRTTTFSTVYQVNIWPEGHAIAFLFHSRRPTAVSTEKPQKMHEKIHTSGTGISHFPNGFIKLVWLSCSAFIQKLTAYGGLQLTYWHKQLNTTKNNLKEKKNNWMMMFSAPGREMCALLV